LAEFSKNSLLIVWGATHTSQARNCTQYEQYSYIIQADTGLVWTCYGEYVPHKYRTYSERGYGSEWWRISIREYNSRLFTKFPIYKTASKYS